MLKAKYFGWEFKAALTVAIHKIASDLGLTRVQVAFRTDIPTAAIDRQGNVYITNIADDAVLTRGDLERFTGFALHELLHWKYTTFSAIDRDAVDYLIALHNGLEDAFIENRAVERKLTGNVEHLLATLIDSMATEGLNEVSDWADPKQYPFALAVYARKHATVKVPLANGLKPLFDAACERLNKCNDTAQTWKLAEWVFDELCKIQPPPVKPQPPTRPTDGGKDVDAPPNDGEPSDEEGNKDAPTKGGETPTSPAKEGGEVGDAKSPIKRTKVNPNGGKVRVVVVPRSTEPTANVPESARAGGATGDWCMAPNEYHLRDKKLWTINC
jgi:hypothetical protein